MNSIVDAWLGCRRYARHKDKVDLARVDICSAWDVLLIVSPRDGLRQLIRDDQNMRILDFSDW